MIEQPIDCTSLKIVDQNNKIQYLKINEKNLKSFITTRQHKFFTNFKGFNDNDKKNY